jgi:hypothetical protein
MGSYASVASLPAYFKIILEPPGCSSKKAVTSKARPWTMTLMIVSDIACELADLKVHLPSMILCCCSSRLLRL